MGGNLPEAVVRRINLIEVLQDAHPSCPEPPEEAATHWSEQDIRAYFGSNGDKVPSSGGVGGGGGNGGGVEAALGALDINGEALPPSTRPDGKYLCQRIGCSAVYDPQSNPEGCCRYHAVRCSS